MAAHLAHDLDRQDDFIARAFRQFPVAAKLRSSFQFFSLMVADKMMGAWVMKAIRSCYHALSSFVGKRCAAPDGARMIIMMAARLPALLDKA